MNFKNMSIKEIAVLLHMISSSFALAVSLIQTNRIIKASKKYNTPGIVIMLGGLIAAVFGTFTIMSKINKGMRKLNKILWISEDLKNNNK